MNTQNPIAILGAGSWGTALATVCCRAGKTPILWDHKGTTIESINKHHENVPRFPGVPLDPRIKATTLLEKALYSADFAIIAIPAQQIRQTMLHMAPLIKGMPLVIASKGIEQHSGLMMHEVLTQTLPQNPLAILSGPNLAHEVVIGLPTGAVIASLDTILGVKICQTLDSTTFRTHFSQDIIGVQVAGALKNVIAIACGIAKGKNMGENACSTILSNGLTEMVRWGTALGATPQTFFGLSGVGDLVLTCNSLQSRNMAFGIKLGRDIHFSELSSGSDTPLVEGAFTASAALSRCHTLHQILPITYAIDQALKRHWTIDKAVDALLHIPSHTQYANIRNMQTHTK